MTEHLRAAEARSQAVRALGDKPSQRRCAEDQRARAWVSAPAKVELRDSSEGDGLNYIGYASVTERGYEMYDLFGPYTEIVAKGAFDETLAMRGLDTEFSIGHDSIRRIARTTNGSLRLAPDEHGLRVEAPNLDPTDHDVAYIVPKLRSGLIDEMSFKFTITSGAWSPDFTEFRINAVDLHRGDVSIVGYGASPWTAGSGLRSADFRAMSDEQFLATERSIRAERSRRFPAPAMSRSTFERIYVETR